MRTGKHIKNILFRSIGLFVFLILWELAPRLGWVREIFLSPPSVVITALIEMLLDGSLMPHIVASLLRIFRGLLLAASVGVIMGLLFGYFRRVNQTLDLLFQFFRQISAFALFPVFILFFGLGEVSKTAIIFWASLWPILLNTSAGVRDVEPVLIRSVKSMGASKMYTFLNVILPGATPQIFTGIRLGGSYCVMAVVAAEMIGATSGLGYLVLYSQQIFKVPQMYAAIVALALLGIALNGMLGLLERFFSSWRKL
ncbi:MAG: ABC transporter permease [Ruminococcus sp.]|jgi:NitT/TauT family transport system permease protein|nr:ABC transporter permease [Ruminococcus sp.]